MTETGVVKQASNAYNLYTLSVLKRTGHKVTILQYKHILVRQSKQD